MITDPDLTPAIAGSDLDTLRARLARNARSERLAEIVYRTVGSPVGDLMLSATERGLLRIAFASEGFDEVLDELAHRVGPRILRDPGRLDPAARQLGEYFDGARREFDLAFDPALSHGFRREVQRALPAVRYGSTTTYKQLAARLGHPKAVRAVGSACATNPWPIVIPCHRVVRTDGGLGGYLGGLAAKTALLEMEQAVAA